MKELKLQARIRREKRKVKSRSENIVVSNLLNRDFKASSPNEKWVTDVSYLSFNNQRLYLSVIYDLFNNEVISYQISRRNDLKLVWNTVHKALKSRKVTKSITLHSDQGFQYTSLRYQNLLKQKNIIPSMSRKITCLDNACIESLFGHFKSEVMYLNQFLNAGQVKKAIFRYVSFYNTERYQKKLNNLSLEFRTLAS